MAKTKLTPLTKSKLTALFKKYKAIKLVYLFGSRATGKAGPASDYDFAVYVDPKKGDDSFDLLLTLMGHIPVIHKTDKVDVVILNQLKSNIILKNNTTKINQSPLITCQN